MASWQRKRPKLAWHRRQTIHSHRPPRRRSAVPEDSHLRNSLRRSRSRNKSRGRNWTHNLDKLVYWLTLGPSKDHALTNFALDTNRTTDGAALWSFFEAWSKRADAAADVDADEGRKTDGRTGSRALATAAEDKTQPSVPAPRTLAQPVIHLSTNHSMVECHGPATYQLRDVLKGPSLGMTFDSAEDRKCWFKRVGASDGEREAFVHELELECAKHGVALRGTGEAKTADVRA